MLAPSGRAKALPDTFTSTAGIVIVRDPLRQVSETLDPGLHQFLPIEMHRRPAIAPPDAPFQSLKIHGLQDTNLDDISDVYVSLA